MVSQQSIKDQLEEIGFKHTGWGRTEVSELHKIILPDEKILELVNGFYEGGFAILVATDVRVLLVDKKPMKYLTVEDLRFDMINEMDYSHRFIGANISIATGNKTLKFTSLNQPRLRSLISHVQHSMAEAKKQQNVHAVDQKSHLEQINRQLQAYLVEQQQHQLQLQQIQLAQQQGQAPPPLPEPIKPSPELSDYLYAQSLLAQYEAQTGKLGTATKGPATSQNQLDELYKEGRQEIFGKDVLQTGQIRQNTSHTNIALRSLSHIPIPNPLEINPMRVAYSKLPMALRNRKFGRPSFHAHSEATPTPETEPTY